MNRSSRTVTGFAALITAAILFLTPLNLLYAQGHTGHTATPAAPQSKTAAPQPKAAATPQSK
ncbi:MAG: hypothetical protein M0Q01_14380, partial [Syntrophales bacterium]|nr:hypothetical protein [Syntrophales bacterium]